MHPVGSGGFYFDPSSDKKDAHFFNANGRTNKKIGKYYHIVGIADRSKNVSIIYVNGEREGHHVWPSGNKSPSNSYWAIGNNPLNPTEGFNGVIDEVRLYNRALSADEVKKLYHYSSALSQRSERQQKKLERADIRKDSSASSSSSSSASRPTKRQAYLDFLEAKGANTATALRQFIGKYSNTSEAKSYVERAQKELRQLE